MKKPLVLSSALLLTATPAGAVDLPVWTQATPCTGTTCTRTAPTLATEGMGLGLVEAYRITLCAAAGQTLAGAGTLEVRLWDPSATAWARHGTTLEPIAGQRCVTWDDVPVAARLRTHRVAVIPVGITVSGGADVTVRIHPYTSR